MGGTYDYVEKVLTSFCEPRIIRGKYGAVSRDNQLIIPLEYDFIQAFTFWVDQGDEEKYDYPTYFLAKRNQKWGVLDENNQTTVPFVWDSLKPFSGDRFLLGEIDLPDNTSQTGIHVEYGLFGRNCR